MKIFRMLVSVNNTNRVEEEANSPYAHICTLPCSPRLRSDTGLCTGHFAAVMFGGEEFSRGLASCS